MSATIADPRTVLRRMLRRHAMSGRLIPLLRLTLFPLALRDPDDRVLIESHPDAQAPAEPRAPIRIDGELVGWACGVGAVAVAAEAFALLVMLESEKKAVAAEALHRYKELSLIYEFTGKLTDDSGTVTDLARRVAEEAKQAIEADAYRVLFAKPESRELELVASVGAPLTKEALYAAARALATGRTQLIDHLDREPDWAGAPLEERSHLCAPLKTSKEVFGVLAIAASRGEAFKAEDEKLATALAVISGLAIADALATVELRAHRDHLQDLVLARTRKLEETLAELEGANRELERLSHVDALTGVANRRSFDRILYEEWKRAVRGSYPLTLLMIDVDCFKPYNDLYGHQAGDECLRSVAQALAGALPRASDKVARYGGEEFAVTLPSTDALGGAQVAEKLRRAVASLQIPHASSTAGNTVTISGGIASVVPPPSGEVTSLIEAADRNLYRAKREGRNRFI